MARNRLGNGVVIKAWRFIIDLELNINQPKRNTPCTLVQCNKSQTCGTHEAITAFAVSPPVWQGVCVWGGITAQMMGQGVSVCPLNPNINEGSQEKDSSDTWKLTVAEALLLFLQRAGLRYFSPTSPLRYDSTGNYSINLSITPSSENLQFFLVLFLEYYSRSVPSWDEDIRTGFLDGIKALTGLAQPRIPHTGRVAGIAGPC